MFINLTLSVDEANSLANLLDLAVKAGGIRTAAVALPFLQRLEDAARDAKPAPLSTLSADKE
jgi:hypothetical protein